MLGPSLVPCRIDTVSGGETRLRAGAPSWRFPLTKAGTPPVGRETRTRCLGLFLTGNGLYFDVRILGEPGDLDGRPGRRVGRKISGIYLIDRNKISKVLQKNGGCYHLIKGQPLGLQDVLNIFENPAGLLPDISTTKSPVAGSMGI